MTQFRNLSIGYRNAELRGGRPHIGGALSTKNAVHPAKSEGEVTKHRLVNLDRFYGPHICPGLIGSGVRSSRKFLF